MWGNKINGEVTHIRFKLQTMLNFSRIIMLKEPALIKIFGFEQNNKIIRETVDDE